MKNYLDDIHKSIRSAFELVTLLEGINEKCKLSNFEKEGVQEDIQSVKNIIQLLQQVQSKEQIREVWNLFQIISRNFGGYEGGLIGIRLNKAHTKLWKNLLNALASSQEEK